MWKPVEKKKISTTAKKRRELEEGRKNKKERGCPQFYQHGGKKEYGYPQTIVNSGKK
ncbi:MAG: hypothetical protein K2H43_06720 [Clostridia bacterium]|nr:hypothetical protein [Clostridia bacterium]